MPKRFPTPDPQIITYEDGTHYVRVADRERSLRTKDFKVAAKRKPEVLAAMDNSGVASSTVKFGFIIDEYQRFRKKGVATGGAKRKSANKPERGRKVISFATYREIEKIWELNLGPFWNNQRISKTTTEKWERFVDQSDLIDLANPRKVFKGLLKWCAKRNYLKHIPELPIPPVNRRERRVLKAHEIRKLFEHAHGSVLIFISMYLFMGMRRKEIMTLQWSDIFFVEKYLVLRKSEVKIRKGRAIPLNAFVYKLLMARKNEQENKKMATDFVFPNRKNRKRHGDLSGLKTAWRTIMRKCGWETGYITPHDLRATFEAYAHKDNSFTDTQREKFAGASIEVQKKTYVNFDADDIRGLEKVVKVEGLKKILSQKMTGKRRGDSIDGKLH